MGIVSELTERQAHEINDYIMYRYEPTERWGMLQIKLKNGEIVLTTYPLIMDGGILYVK